MGQHTPRPWRLEQVGWEGQYIYGKDKRVPGVDRFIASVSLHFDGAEANARLIAAAPELLEALRDVTARCEAYYGSEYPATKRGLAAIAKAEGRE